MVPLPHEDVDIPFSSELEDELYKYKVIRIIRIVSIPTKCKLYNELLPCYNDQTDRRELGLTKYSLF